MWKFMGTALPLNFNMVYSYPFISYGWPVLFPGFLNVVTLTASTFCHVPLCIARPMPSCSVRLSVRLSVTFVVLRRNE